jgi:hypothetical protein
MGINKNSLRFLVLAQKMGVDFSKTAMIGRQTLNMPESHFVAVMENETGLSLNREQILEAYKFRFAEKSLQLLGAKQVDSFDFSDYEQATYTHDFNLPVAKQFYEKYTLVIDGGSLEHIFNFPIAIKNCMEMVALNGHFISFTPANNYFGHGFYQFSPELYYRILNNVNGFRVKEMFYCDDKFNQYWKSIVDPDKVKQRVTLLNHKPTMLHLLAERIAITTLFEKPPQQSDYQLAWNTINTSRLKSKPSIIRLIKNLIPITARIYFNRMFFSKPNSEFFEKINIVDKLKSN